MIAMIKQLISKRRLIQGFTAVMIYGAVSWFGLLLLYVLAGGAALGLLFGKVFCRWMCPIGFIVELLFQRAGGDGAKMYNYHKLGCPIAWIGGLLNRGSIFSIQHDPAACTDCGLCDKACYISSLNGEYSHFRHGKKRPGSAYSCSRCLACVNSCPKGSLTYSLDV